MHLSPPPDALRAAFHGDPADGIDLPGDGPVHRWLRGVCLGALGRYGAAAADLVPGGEPAGSLAASTRASHLRQLGRHAEAEPLDRWAAEHAGADPDPLEAGADAAVGLVADAVGQGDLDAVGERLAAAGRLVGRMSGPEYWRARVRLWWVRGEVALLRGDPPAARECARRALAGARAADAPRHEAKSLLLLGVAGAGELPGAADVLDRAARLAARFGLVPLVWPARLVRSRLVAGSDDRAVAVAALRAIAGELSQDEAAEFLARQREDHSEIFITRTGQVPAATCRGRQGHKRN